MLEYDDVMNKQREIIYGQRKQVLDGMDVKGIIMNMMNTSITNLVSSISPGRTTSTRPVPRAAAAGGGAVLPRYAVRFTEEELGQKTQEDFVDAFTQAAAAYYEQKEQEFTSP